MIKKKRMECKSKLSNISHITYTKVKNLIKAVFKAIKQVKADKPHQRTVEVEKPLKNEKNIEN